MIGRAFVSNTVGSDRFSANQLDHFFGTFRSTHRSVLNDFIDRGDEIIGSDEHHELDQFGLAGKFAGRMSLRESGLAIVESKLHGSVPDGLEVALRKSCEAAVATLRN